MAMIISSFAVLVLMLILIWRHFKRRISEEADVYTGFIKKLLNGQFYLYTDNDCEIILNEDDCVCCGIELPSLCELELHVIVFQKGVLRFSVDGVNIRYSYTIKSLE